MALWRSSLDIRFRRGTFHSFACGNSFVNVIIYFYCNPQLGYNFFSVHLLMPTFTPQNIHHHDLNYPTCYISVFLHHCAYPVQHILGDGGFYFVCIHIQHCCCITIFVIWSILILKIRLKDTMKAFGNFKNEQQKCMT